VHGLKKVERVIQHCTQLGKNIRSRLRGAGDGLPIPPHKLLTLVAGGSDISWFLEIGRQGAESTIEILARNGVRTADFRSILDFGCGCGRVIRHLRSLQTPKLCGSDYNRALIEWCQRNLSFAEFSTNGLLPPLGYADDAFDLVYSLSVFTHLPEGMQLDWIKELRRVISPGGYLLITTHGESYMSVMLPEEKDRFCAGQLVTRSETHAGTNTCAAFHPPAYVRRTLANGFEVIDFVPEGAKGNPHQDVFLLRKAGIA
jgi:SAM-dependent methyltransferase